MRGGGWCCGLLAPVTASQGSGGAPAPLPAWLPATLGTAHAVPPDPEQRCLLCGGWPGSFACRWAMATVTHLRQVWPPCSGWAGVKGSSSPVAFVPPTAFDVGLLSVPVLIFILRAGVRPQGTQTGLCNPSSPDVTVGTCRSPVPGPGRCLWLRPWQSCSQIGLWAELGRSPAWEFETLGFHRPSSKVSTPGN